MCAYCFLGVGWLDVHMLRVCCTSCRVSGHASVMLLTCQSTCVVWRVRVNYLDDHVGTELETSRVRDMPWVGAPAPCKIVKRGDLRERRPDEDGLRRVVPPVAAARSAGKAQEGTGGRRRAQEGTGGGRGQKGDRRGLEGTREERKGWGRDKDGTARDGTGTRTG